MVVTNQVTTKVKKDFFFTCCSFFLIFLSTLLASSSLPFKNNIRDIHFFSILDFSCNEFNSLKSAKFLKVASFPDYLELFVKTHLTYLIYSISEKKHLTQQPPWGLGHEEKTKELEKGSNSMIITK